VVDLEKTDGKSIIKQALKWLWHVNPAVLNVGGPRESNCPGIYLTTFAILRMIIAHRGYPPIQ